MEIRRIAAGSVSGALATLPMSGWMLAGQALTPHGEQPPKRLVRGFAHRAGIPTKRRGVVTVLATGAAHLGFGAACGALYATVIRRSSIPRGLAFGLSVWASSYAGWIPALRLLPPPHQDRPGRAWTILSAHLVYGAAVAAALAGFDDLAQHAPGDLPADQRTMTLGISSNADLPGPTDSPSANDRHEASTNSPTE